MTLLVLLLSVAVLEYVTRRSDPASGRGTNTAKNREAVVPSASPQPSPAPNLAPALLQLGRAVEQFGRGQAPQPSPPVATPKEETKPVP